MSNSEALRTSLIRRIYNINAAAFEAVALDLWEYQYENNLLYSQYCDLIRRKAPVRNIEDIPFLPIQFFRQHEIKTGAWKSECIFKSSGTTGSITSQHHIRDLNLYHQTAQRCFQDAIGEPAHYKWIGLLPSYLERPDSSLVSMVQYFIQQEASSDSAFYPEITNELLTSLRRLANAQAPVILMGVSFALLDLFTQFDVPVWDNLLVIETGGMKGRRRELTRNELYEQLRFRHPALRIASEYGMTELMSQVYRITDRFQPSPFLRVQIRDISDPLEPAGFGRRGAINIIDLANIDSCAFIATDDVGISWPDGSFDVLGRLDNSDLRGCNLMYN